MGMVWILLGLGCKLLFLILSVLKCFFRIFRFVGIEREGQFSTWGLRMIHPKELYRGSRAKQHYVIVRHVTMRTMTRDMIKMTIKYHNHRVSTCNEYIHSDHSPFFKRPSKTRHLAEQFLINHPELHRPNLGKFPQQTTVQYHSRLTSWIICQTNIMPSCLWLPENDTTLPRPKPIVEACFSLNSSSPWFQLHPQVNLKGQADRKATYS